MAKHTLSTNTILGAFAIGMREGAREFCTGWGKAMCIVVGFDIPTPR